MFRCTCHLLFFRWFRLFSCFVSCSHTKNSNNIFTFTILSDSLIIVGRFLQCVYSCFCLFEESDLLDSSRLLFLELVLVYSTRINALLICLYSLKSDVYIYASAQSLNVVRFCWFQKCHLLVVGPLLFSFFSAFVLYTGYIIFLVLTL
jgi:hypothetical protein